MSNDKRLSKKALQVNNNLSNKLDQYIYRNDVVITDDNEIKAGLNPNNSTSQLVSLDFQEQGETFESTNNNNNVESNFELIDNEDLDDCKDGSHRDFAENLNDQLLQLAEGYADPTPSVLLGDFEPAYSEEEFFETAPVELSVGTKTSTEGKSQTTNFSASTVNTNSGRFNKNIVTKREYNNNTNSKKMSERVGSHVSSSKARTSNKKKGKHKNNQHPQNYNNSNNNAANNNTGSHYSGKSGSNISSKNRLPTWMQQAEEVIESDSYHENMSGVRSNKGQGYLESQGNNTNSKMNMHANSHLNDRHSQATGHSTNKSLPSWMQNAADNNEIEDNINDDLDDHDVEDVDDAENFDDLNDIIDRQDGDGDDLNGDYLNETAVPNYLGTGKQITNGRSSHGSQPVASVTSSRSDKHSFGERLSGHQSNGQGHYRERGTGSFTQQFSQKSQDSANWTQNRAYFLRMNKMNEKDNSNRSWTKMAKSSGKGAAPAFGTERDATIRALTDELDETKIQNRTKENLITDLHEQINQLQESQIQEEVDRVEAEISRERAINDNRQLVIDKADLHDEIKRIEKQMKRQQAEMEQKIQQELEHRLTEQNKVTQLEKELECTKNTAENIKNQMTTLDAVMMEKDYARAVMQTESIIREHQENKMNQSQSSKPVNATLETSACQTEDSVLMVTMVQADVQTQNNEIIEVIEQTTEKQSPSLQNTSCRSTDASLKLVEAPSRVHFDEYNSSASDRNSSDEYSDNADDEQTVVSNIHISRRPKNEKSSKSPAAAASSSTSKKEGKRKPVNLNPNLSASSSLRRIQTMPSLRTDSGFLNKVFTNAAANSSYLNMTFKSIFGGLIVANLTNDIVWQHGVGAGKFIYEMMFKKENTRINQNAKFFTSGYGQHDSKIFEGSQINVRRVNSMESLPQKQSLTDLKKSDASFRNSGSKLNKKRFQSRD